MKPWVKQGHRWLGLIVGAQLLLWLLSGLVMAVLPQAEIKGDARFELKPKTASFTVSESPDFAALLTQHKAESLRLIAVAGKPLLEIVSAEQRYLLDPRSMARVALTATDIARLAAPRWRGAGDMQTPVLESTRTHENRDYPLPVWRVDFASVWADSLFLDAVNGQVLGASNDWSRLFDVFWMLHIMDYSTRTDFNHPLLISAAVLAVLMALSGAWLLLPVCERLGRRLLARRWHVLRLQAGAEPMRELRVRAETNLFEVLSLAGYPLPSSCGGGGSCGLCRVALGSHTAVSAADASWLGRAALDRGERLACQHTIKADMAFRLPERGPAPDFKARVLGRSFLSPTLFELRLQLSAPLAFSPGDHVRVQCPPFAQALGELDLPAEFARLWQDRHWQRLQAQSATAFSRAYSIANATDTPTELTLLIRLALPLTEQVPVGLGSSFLAGVPEGTELALSGPFGDFHLRAGDRPLLLVAGGAGLAPIRSMVHELCRVRADRRAIHCWYGTRTALDCVYRAEFAALTRQADLRYTEVLSEEPPTSSWPGYRGLLHEALAQAYSAEQLRAMDIYVCGPPAMIASVQVLLNKAGVAAERIAVDAFS